MIIHFSNGIMDAWPHQPQHKKDAMIEALHYEYRRVASGQDFNTKYMLKHRRSETNKVGATKEGQASGHDQSIQPSLLTHISGEQWPICL